MHTKTTQNISHSMSLSPQTIEEKRSKRLCSSFLNFPTIYCNWSDLEKNQSINHLSDKEKKWHFTVEAKVCFSVSTIKYYSAWSNGVLKQIDNDTRLRLRIGGLPQRAPEINGKKSHKTETHGRRRIFFFSHKIV